jgi:hypothetical protein
MFPANGTAVAAKISPDQARSMRQVSAFDHGHVSSSARFILLAVMGCGSRGIEGQRQAGTGWLVRKRSGCGSGRGGTWAKGFITAAWFWARAGVMAGERNAGTARVGAVRVVLGRTGGQQPDPGGQCRFSFPVTYSQAALHTDGIWPPE